MKKTLIILVGLALSFGAISQAPVPFSWAFPNTILPTGFTLGGGSYPPSFYASNGNVAAPSFKLNGTGQWLEIEIAAEAGEISYFLKGQNVGGAPFQGTLDIEFSPNGTTWTSTRTLVNAAISTSSYTQFKDTCLPNTRFIRFYYTNKVSGVNISLDDIEIGVPLATPEAEINTLIGNDTVFSGANYYTSENVGTTKRIKVVVENQGTDSTLRISGVTSSNPTEFSVVSFPSSVDSLSNDTIVIDFAPTAAGTRNSTISIANNDASENPYIINFIGYGNGLATEPSTPASVSFSNVTTYKYEVNFTPASPLSDESYLVLFKNGSAPTGIPTDGIEYTKGESIGNAKVAYVGKNLSYLSKETYANSTYNLAVFAYSGSGVYSNYNSVARTGSVTTPVSMQSPTHYNGVSVSSPNFVTQLHNKTNPHTLMFYSDFDDTYIQDFDTRDTTNSQQVVSCAYSGEPYIYSAPFNFSVISREHTYPQSWMPTYGDQTKPEYNDYHNLYPVHQNSANAVRSNKPLGKVVTVISSYGGAKYGLDHRGKQVYEPRDSHKGNAARAIFYMAAAYNSVDGNSWTLPDPIDAFTVPYSQEEDILKKWHWMDPVDEQEMARNDYIESLQNNRNPFIDSMNYACYIDFKTMTKETNAGPCLTNTISLEEKSSVLDMVIFPNPTSHALTIQYALNQPEEMTLSIFNTLGVLVKIGVIEGQERGYETIDVSGLKAGIYQVRISGNSFASQMKFVKQ
ncbi:MAG: endonuclease [Flavobacteriales bacterium]